MKLSKLTQRASQSHDKCFFKTDQMTWGVPLASDRRMTGARFGTFKTAVRKESEAKLRNYLQLVGMQLETRIVA